MPKHFIWSLIRRRMEWFRIAQQRGVSYACRYFGISRKTYYKWFKRYTTEKNNPKALKDLSRRPKTHPKTTPKEVVNVIIQLRKQTNFGPRRLQFFLKRDYNINISICAIYKVLNRQGLIKRYKRKRKLYQSYAKYIHHPGQKIQLDVKHVKLPHKTLNPRLYQYSAKDIYSKLRFIRIYDEVSVNNTEDFLKRMVTFFPFKIRSIQTDHGSEFAYTLANTNRVHIMDSFCDTNKINHVLSPVATPRYNGQVERSHRTDEEEFYRRTSIEDLPRLKHNLLRYLRYYNEQRPHMAIGMFTPLQKLQAYKNSESIKLSYRCYL